VVVTNGRGPFLFLIDTATSHAVLIPPCASNWRSRRLSA
jgi:hypothetical protein